jgi:hypothetical protein
MRPNVRKVDETVDPAQHVIVRDVLLEAEAIETAPLASPAVRPSSTKSPVATTRESAPNSTIKRSFSTQFVDSSRLLCANSGHSATCGQSVEPTTDRVEWLEFAPLAARIVLEWTAALRGNKACQGEVVQSNIGEAGNRTTAAVAPPAIPPRGPRDWRKLQHRARLSRPDAGRQP